MTLIELRERLTLVGARERTPLVMPLSGDEFAVPPGWTMIVAEMVERLLTLPATQHPAFDYIVERDGLLDFRWSGDAPTADRAIAYARARASFRCVLCGVPGKLRHIESGDRALCDGHADLVERGQQWVEFHEIASASCASSRQKVLIGIAWLPERECWVLRHDGREDEIGTNQTDWLAGWIQGINEEADLYSVDSAGNLAGLHRLLAIAGGRFKVTINDARTILFHAARRTRLDEAALRRLCRSVTDPSREIRIAAFGRLTDLFRSQVS